ncbi:hypothetical protein [Deinococcus pimensis]|uniref:hypothetical protein n=1 Tax=Deinococcus pimensis TaxID=309888 RepID=UPI000694CC32|nr:hypothetical protein [Deinococcus pimensis]
MTLLETPLGSINLQDGHITYAESAWKDLDDEGWRKEDLLQVEYQGGFILDVGWYGDEQFHIYIIRDADWSSPVFHQTVTNRTASLPLLDRAIVHLHQLSNSLTDRN